MGNYFTIFFKMINKQKLFILELSEMNCKAEHTICNKLWVFAANIVKAVLFNY